jgi:ankyrin repeat protein
LDIGVDPAAQDGYKMTALHWAAANGCMSVIERLLERGAPLEVENMWGGTVLDSTMHFVLHQPVKSVDYAAVFELLLAAGANPNAVDPSPSGNARVDDVLRRYRGRAGTQSSP